MTLLELATQISQDLGSPDTPTAGVIQYWLRHSIFSLNNLINTSYEVKELDGTIDPELSDNDSSILKGMYFVYYYSVKVRENLGAAAVDPVLEVAENGAMIRFGSRNNIAQSFIQLKRQEQENLNKLVNFYRCNRATPQSVDGDDVTDTVYDGTNPVRSTAS